MRKELDELRTDYLNKATALFKENENKIFRLKREIFHYNYVLDPEVSTTYYDGYIKIIGHRENGQPIVRLMHIDLRVNGYMFEEKKARYYVNVHNFYGYTYSSLIDFIDDCVDDESELPQFVLDVLNDDYEIDGYIVHIDEVQNNIKPWEKKKA